jgi:hypothetical protein
MRISHSVGKSCGFCEWHDKHMLCPEHENKSGRGRLARKGWPQALTKNVSSCCVSQPNTEHAASQRAECIGFLLPSLSKEDGKRTALVRALPLQCVAGNLIKVDRGGGRFFLV